MTKPEPKPIRALFIDTIKREVREIELKQGGSYREIYPLLSMPGLRPCDDINIVRLDSEGHYIYVDGEGLLKDPEYWMFWKGYANPLAGHAVIVRIDDEGESASCKLAPDYVAGRLKYSSNLQMHGFVQKVEEIEMFGRPGTRITNLPVIRPRHPDGEGEPLDLDEIAVHMGLPPGTLKWTAIETEEGESDAEERAQ